jgi:hypothetical protein
MKHEYRTNKDNGEIMRIRYVGVDRLGSWFHFNTFKLSNRFIYVTLFRLGFEIKINKKVEK